MDSVSCQATEAGAAPRSNATRCLGGWPHRTWVGLLLVAICWPLNWMLPGMRTAYLFFPLWLGYILTVDGLVERRKGNSLWTRSRAQFAILFLVSAPVWWLFELINWRTMNWEYLGRESFNLFEYNLLCTICFSTVMPAVFVTAELMGSFGWMARFKSGPRITATRRLCLGLFGVGVVMLACLLIWPKLFYPCVWMSLVLILEPVNRWLRHPHLLQDLESGDWRRIISLASGSLVCGFFWEMWNYYSYPKWIYHTPGAEFLHVFEMPLLGYFGYIPFAFELYALKNLLRPKGPQSVP